MRAVKDRLAAPLMAKWGKGKEDCATCPVGGLIQAIPKGEKRVRLEEELFDVCEARKDSRHRFSPHSRNSPPVFLISESFRCRS